MTVMVGKKMKVFIEIDDGTVIDLSTVATNVMMHSGINGYTHFSIDGICTSDPFYSQDVKKMKTSDEWKCTYCDRPNKRKDEVCKSCGGVRSFIYG